MPSYFLAIPADQLEAEMGPALAACRQAASFVPVQPLCARLLPAVESVGVADTAQLLQAALQGAAFDRHLWRALAGDLLLLAAARVPEIRLAPRSLYHLLGVVAAGQGPRDRFTPIEQALCGSRELNFGPYPYRPLEVGWNDRQDVDRLARFLASLDPGRWQPADLAGLPELEDADDRAEELAFVAEGLLALREFYDWSAESACAIVCESLIASGTGGESP